MLTNINHAVIFVSDQRAALDFYVGKVGFELRHCSTGGILYRGYHLCVGLAGSPTTLVLALRTAGEEARSNPIMLACDDLRQTYEELAAKGVEFTMTPIGGLEWVRFVDPDGNEFHLSEHNKNWIDEAALKRLMQGIPDFP
jgi:catechol 2,3-dioxygenase-like lactoylglutathione lyase family enzyme